MTFRPAGKDVTMDRQISCGMTSLGRKVISDKVKDEQTTPAGRIPRVARLMALAIHFETLIADGIVKDHTEIAGLGYVSRAGMTQIMKLQPVTPGIQEAILDLPPIKQGSQSRRGIFGRVQPRNKGERQWRLWQESLRSRRLPG